ncbi:hypothetical protein LCGC14_0785850 [marine sediment metagenome]|uniref:Uncharacterized protein n=1 Tax=marine sediment metagenome TaxID=412755 RepID=A0A0F9T141_9ZZZZ
MSLAAHVPAGRRGQQVRARSTGDQAVVVGQTLLARHLRGCKGRSRLYADCQVPQLDERGPPRGGPCPLTFGARSRMMVLVVNRLLFN